MLDLLIGLIFLALVASPAIGAALPMSSSKVRERRTDNADLRFPSPSSSR